MSCGADKYQYLVDKDASELERASIKQYLRIVPYNGPITTDIQAERMNIWLDDANVIERVDCG